MLFDLTETTRRFSVAPGTAAREVEVEVAVVAVVAARKLKAPGLRRTTNAPGWVGHRWRRGIGRNASDPYRPYELPS